MSAAGPNRVYAGTRYGPAFVANRHDPFFDAALERYGEWSWAEVAFWAQFLEAGDLVISAGVNVGCHLVALAQLVGPQGRVVGFEPQAPLWRLALANTVLCNVDGWTQVVHGALGPEEGRILVPVMDFHRDNSFGGLSLTKTEAPDEIKVPVALYPIDALLLDRCDFIQLDVEGMELHALRGAERTLRDHHPHLYVEASFEEERYPLWRYLRAEGYDVWWHIAPLFSATNWKGDSENVWPDTVSQSWFCVHRSRERPACVEGLRAVTDGDWEG